MEGGLTSKRPKLPFDRSSPEWQVRTEVSDKNLTGVFERQAIQRGDLSPNAAGYKRKWVVDTDDGGLKEVAEGAPGSRLWGFGSSADPIVGGNRGWKLHITSSVEDLEIVSRATAEVLNSMGIHHKIVLDAQRFQRGFATGSQQGKFITVYIGEVGGIAIRDKLVRALDQQLLDLKEFGGIKPGAIPIKRVGDVHHHADQPSTRG